MGVGRRHPSQLRDKDNKEIHPLPDKVTDLTLENLDQAAQTLLNPINRHPAHSQIHLILRNTRLHLSATRIVCQPNTQLTDQEEEDTHRGGN